MGTLGSIAGTAFDVFENVHSIVTFYMFIIEESIQTVGMACWMARQAGDYAAIHELAHWAKTELCDELGHFANNAGFAAYPMNVAFDKFAEASKKNFDYLLTLEGSEA